MFESITNLVRLIRLYHSLSRRQREDIVRISEAYAQSSK